MDIAYAPNPPPTDKPRGRPAALTLDRQARILALIAQGNYYDTACRASGVSYDTFRDAMRCGEAGDPKFSDFYLAVLQAESDHESSTVGSLFTSKDDSIRLRMLGRRHRDRWAEQTNVNIKASTETTVTHTLTIGDAASLLGLISTLQPAQLVEGTVIEQVTDTE